MQVGFERLLAAGSVSFVALGVDECVPVAGLPSHILLYQPEITAVSTEENIAGPAAKDLETMLIVGGNLRIGPVSDEFVAGVTLGLPTMTTCMVRPSKGSLSEQVVVPLVWPGVKWAVSVVTIILREIIGMFNT